MKAKQPDPNVCFSLYLEMEDPQSEEDLNRRFMALWREKTMFEYKGTEKFDIGAVYGELEYDFFAINDEDDFWTLMNHYGAIYRRFDYLLDGYETTENNTRLSPIVQTKMKEHNANLCLTLLEEEFFKKNVSIRKMVVNELTPDNIYNTYFIYYYYFTMQGAKNCFEQGVAYAKSNMHNAAIRYFSHSIKLSPNSASPYFYRGLSYMSRKKYDRAIEDFTQAININPEDSDAFTLRGFVYNVTYNFDKANADLTKALEINPDNKMAKECLEEIIRRN